MFDVAISKAECHFGASRLGSSEKIFSYPEHYMILSEKKN